MVGRRTDHSLIRTGSQVKVSDILMQFLRAAHGRRFRAADRIHLFLHDHSKTGFPFFKGEVASFRLNWRRHRSNHELQWLINGLTLFFEIEERKCFVYKIKICKFCCQSRGKTKSKKCFSFSKKIAEYSNDF